jgi:hypothetical protein
MYFYDNGYYGDISAGLRTVFGNAWNSYYEFGNYVYANHPDGTLGVYYSPSRFTGSTSDIQNFTSQITETSCNAMKDKFNELRDDVTNAMKDGIAQFPSIPPSTNILDIYPANSQTFTNTNYLNPNFPSVYWDSVTSKCMARKGRLDYLSEDYVPNQNGDCCNADESVNFSKLMTQPLSDVTTIEDFEYYISSELIDVKSRKVLSGYPTLRALYDRYTNSSDYCPTTSSAFDYTKMDQFAHLIDSYWVDIVEQVVPATTIWGSVKIYGNTMFDQQKFEYKKGSLFTCTDEMTCNGFDAMNECLFNIIDTYYLKKGGCQIGTCDDKITTFGLSDFMDDPRNMPTPAEIDSFGSLNCAHCKYTNLQSVIDSYPEIIDGYDVYDYMSDYRAQIDEFNENSNLTSLTLMNGFCYDELTNDLPNINSFKTMLNPLSPQYNQTPSFPWKFYLKGVPKKINTFKPYKIYLDSFWYKTAADGQPKLPNQILSAYTDTVQFIKAVPDIYHLPLVGKAGDIIQVGTPLTNNDVYWWNPEASGWELADFEDYYDTQILQRNARLKALNEFNLASKPYMWAGNYLLLHPFKKWVMQNATPVTGKQIIETGGQCLPCMYTNTIDCETTNTFCLGERNDWSNFDCNTQEP